MKLTSGYFEKNYYFSLKELIEFVNNSNYSFYEKDNVETFLQKIQESPYNIKLIYLPFNEDELITNLLNDFFARYYNHACVKTIEHELKYTDCLKFIVLLVNKIRTTWDYYSEILKIYEQTKNKLLDGVKLTSKSRGRFNDTPQLQDSDDEFDTDKYASTLTIDESEQTSDIQTKMMRVKEIQDHYQNVWENWLNNLHSVLYEIEVE